MRFVGISQKRCQQAAVFMSQYNLCLKSIIKSYHRLNHFGVFPHIEACNAGRGILWNWHLRTDFFVPWARVWRGVWTLTGVLTRGGKRLWDVWGSQLMWGGGMWISIEKKTGENGSTIIFTLFFLISQAFCAVSRWTRKSNPVQISNVRPSKREAMTALVADRFGVTIMSFIRGIISRRYADRRHSQGFSRRYGSAIGSTM